ncbi:MAG TPA: hypothetical protein VK363_11955 [Pyrinomonadaceae bacterium]|nr:hypothetical protein [Pyrinomonadaceae bacterium]
MKNRSTIIALLAVLLVLSVGYILTSPTGASQRQKSMTTNGHSEIRARTVVGVVIESVAPFTAVESPEPMTTITLRNVSQKEIGYVLLVNPKDETVVKVHYLNNSFPPGAASEATITTASAQGLKIVAVAYLDGQIEAVNAKASERAREVHDGFVAEINSAIEKLDSEAATTDPTEAIKRATTPKGKRVQLLGQAMAAEYMRSEIEHTPIAERGARLDHLAARLSKMKAKLKATSAGH